MTHVSIPFTSHTCLVCSQRLSQGADPPQLPSCQQAQLYLWWVTALGKSKAAPCLYFNGSGGWNNVRPLQAWWCFTVRLWDLPWAGLVLVFILIYRGDSNKVTLANNGGHSTVAWQQPPLVSASQISNSLENAMC